MFTNTQPRSQQAQIEDATLVFTAQRRLEAAHVKQQEAALLRNAAATRQPVITPSREALQRSFAEVGALAKSGAITQEQHMGLLAALMPYAQLA